MNYAPTILCLQNFTYKLGSVDGCHTRTQYDQGADIFLLLNMERKPEPHR